VAVGHGGCAAGGVTIAIGNPNRACHGYSDRDANGMVGIGLLGADSYGGVLAVSDSGTATRCSQPLWLDCITLPREKSPEMIA
jgi:hypothetical protein